MGTLNDLAARVHEIAAEHGFWDEERNFGEMIALIHSELSEALEEHRAARPAVWIDPANGKPEGAAVELVDALIRILDTIASLDVDVDEVFELKSAYNESRPYKHGKEY